MNKFLFLLALCVTGCGAESAPEQGASSPPPIKAASGGEAQVTITMEGQTYHLNQVSLKDSTFSFEPGEIQFYLVADGEPVKLNFNLSNTSILELGSAQFDVPEATRNGVVVDLNFFNRERDSKTISKRIIFSKGTIDIKELTTNSLVMSFTGAGHALMEDAEFPIEGSVNLKF